MGLKSSGGGGGGGGGEIVQVQGGHIIRATGRKDRHSKVFTAKGPRDRRVRLAAHTAIQFYDVQDRLGYDRPSKAVDWLINKAKASIDKLAELPPWDPSASGGAVDHDHRDQDHVKCTDIPVADHTGGPSSTFHHHQMHNTSNAYGNMDSQSLNDSIKSFFPTTNISGENPTINFQNYPQSQDLCLSLHTSLQDPGGPTNNEQTVFQGPGSMGFDGGWSDPQTHHDLGRFTRLMGWAGGGGDQATGRGGNGILFNPSLMAPPPQAAYSFQRGTLQSSFSPLFVQHQHQHQHQHHHLHLHNHSSPPGLEDFMGFSIPSQIHGGASSSSLSPDSSQH